MPIFKFTISDVELDAYKHAASLGLFPTAGSWAREALRDAAQSALAKVKPEAAPKLHAKERKQQAMFSTTLGNLLTRIEAGDIPDVESWIARRRRDVGASKPDQAYTEAFAAWCREHGHIKGE